MNYLTNASLMAKNQILLNFKKSFLKVWKQKKNKHSNKIYFQGQRPEIPSSFKNTIYGQTIHKILNESWDHDPNARITAATAAQRLNSEFSSNRKKIYFCFFFPSRVIFSILKGFLKSYPKIITRFYTLGLVDNYYEDPNYESYDMGSPVEE